jgi:hypothetical protein
MTPTGGGHLAVREVRRARETGWAGETEKENGPAEWFWAAGKKKKKKREIGLGWNQRKKRER